jgi:uncharacterized membrane protein YfcA
MSTELYPYIAVCFLTAGLVKGIIGLGFPTIILAMLSLQIGVRDAMALMLLPCFLTNVWQALSGGNLMPILQRIWPFLVCASVMIWVTTALIAAVETWFLSCLLGLVVCTYALIGMTSPGLSTPVQKERWLTPLVGACNGVVTGLTGTFVVPGVLYLQSLRMGKDKLIQAMGILFLTSTTALGAGLFSHNLTSNEYILISAAAVVPSFAGMALGQIIRRFLGEQRFEKVFYISLLLLGLYIVGKCLR